MRSLSRLSRHQETSLQIYHFHQLHEIFCLQILQFPFAFGLHSTAKTSENHRQYWPNIDVIQVCVKQSYVESGLIFGIRLRI